MSPLEIEAPSGERQKCENRSAKSTEWSGVWEGVYLTIRLEGLGSVVSSPAGVRTEPRPETHFLRILKAK